LKRAKHWKRKSPRRAITHEGLERQEGKKLKYYCLESEKKIEERDAIKN